jgi:hypothetical protein
LAVVWDSEDLSKLSKSKNDELVLDHERDKKMAIGIGLHRNLAIEVEDKARYYWFIDFENTIETNIGEHSFNLIRLIKGWIENSTLMNVSIFNGMIETCNGGRHAGSGGDFGNVLLCF